jgi:hypothetical protein
VAVFRDLTNACEVTTLDFSTAFQLFLNDLFPCLSSSNHIRKKVAVFWGVVLVVAASIIRAIIALMMEAAGTSETLVNFYQTARRYNPENSHLRTHRRENLKSYLYR